MIVRVWHGRVPADKAEAYHEFLLRVAVPEYRATPGNRSVMELCRREGGVVHFLLITTWDSLDAIRGFAGDDVEKAHYYPQDSAFLLEFEPTVTHYEVRSFHGGS